MENKDQLYIVASTSSTGGEDLDPDDFYSSKTPTINQIRYKYLSSVKPSCMFYDIIEASDASILNEDMLHLAVVIYNDGDTFGEYYNKQHIVGAYKTYDDAHEAIQSALTGNNHKPWESYFATFIDSDVFALPVRHKP